MPDIGTQLRDYLEETAPPVGVDEIFAKPVSDPPVRPLQPRQPGRDMRAWAYAVAAAVIVGLLVGGVAWLARSQGGSAPADEPTITTLAPDTPPGTIATALDTNRPTDPDLGTAYDVVLDAFTAIHDADWPRFLGHLATDGKIYSLELQAAYPWSDPAIETILSDGVELDFDSNGIVSYAEMFTVAAQYLALQPIEVGGCEPVGDLVECLVTDTAVFHRAAGIEPDPFPVRVREGEIVEIGIGSPREAELTAQTNAPWTLGGCEGCRFELESVWIDITDDYNSWLELYGPDPGSSPGSPEISWIDVRTPHGFAELAWIDPDSFAQHRESIPQWLTSRQPITTVDRDRVEAYIAAVTQSDPPQPAFDTASLGTEQPLASASPEAIGEPFADDIDSIRWSTAATLESAPVSAAYWIDVVDLSGLYVATLNLFIDATTRGSVGGMSADMNDSFAALVAASQIVGNDDATGERTTHAAVGGLPVESAVVAATLSNGARLWQRPVSGLALLDITPDTSVTFSVLDVDGSEILRVATGPDDTFTIETGEPRN